MRKRNLRCGSAALALVLAASAAAAEESRYEMAFYLERPGGAEIAARDYDAAIETAERHRSLGSADALVAATNLCVAYTVRREFAAAERNCDRAVDLARRDDRASLLRRATATAKALNNRGVLRAVRGNGLGASTDFRRAAARAGTWQAPERNLLALASAAPREPALVRSND